MHHSRPLALGLLCTFNVGAFSSSQTLDEYKDILAKRVDIHDRDFKCWVLEADKVKTFFNDNTLQTPVLGVKEYLKVHGGSLVVSDTKIAIMISDTTSLTRDVIDSMCSASRYLFSLALNLPRSGKRLSAKIFNFVVVCLIVALVLAVIWDIAGRLHGM